jgi:hypothetical protein
MSAAGGTRTAARHAVLMEMDAVRQRVEQRLGLEAGDLEALDDPSYDAALGAWSSWKQATDALEAALAEGGGRS